ncbi:hypothetical protein DBV39_03965 [Orrella marina]|uniref:Uncharacterized protein n=1 Tax=Orrella marina TaxID=2163011 RepID=A0A2R4XGV2_9BURK|nr:hypothetical protein DBV39_03965 [Orrella marina]
MPGYRLGVAHSCYVVTVASAAQQFGVLLYRCTCVEYIDQTYITEQKNANHQTTAQALHLRVEDPQQSIRCVHNEWSLLGISINSRFSPIRPRQHDS